MSTKVAREHIFQKAHVIAHNSTLAIRWDTWFKNLSSQFSDLDFPSKKLPSHEIPYLSFFAVNLHENNAGGCGGIWFRYRYAMTAPII